MLHATSMRRDVCAQCPFHRTDEPIPALSTVVHLPPAVIRRTIGDIVADVARRRGLYVGEIESQSRSSHIVQARQEVFWIAYQIRTPTGAKRYSLPMIGRYFQGKGGREKPMDHASVHHGVRKHGERLREALIASIRAANELSAQEHRRAA